MPTTDCEQHLQATVTETTTTHIGITLSAQEKVSCATCANRGGCQSLSVYHWFFEKSAVYLPQSSEAPYRVGETLTLSFPKPLLQNVLLGLLGIPFLGFIFGVLSLSFAVGELGGFLAGIVLAVGGFLLSKKRLNKQLKTAIRLNRLIHN